MNKSKLQEFCDQQSWPLPKYTTVREGPDHNPRFTGTVTVNGVPFQTSAFVCRSSKEAQNEAARIAFDHFTAPKTILQRPNAGAPPEPSSTGFPASDAKLNAKASASGILPPTKLEGQNFQANHVVVTPAKGNLYKNLLQNYALKRNLALPMYACEIDGPPHARRFKSRVTINGNTYEAPEFFSTLKEAEHAAAQVAFEALPPDDVQEDEGLYRSLLQDLAQKLGFRFLTYETNKSGPPHMPCFLSTVEIGNGRFQGQEAMTKKQAEMSAEKVAYTGLTKGKAECDGTDVSKVSQTMGASVLASSNLESTMINKFLPNTKSIPNAMQLNIKGNAVLSNGGEQIEKCKVSGLATEKDAAFSPGKDIVGASLAKDLQQQAQLNVSDKKELHKNSLNNALAQEQVAEKSGVPDNAKWQKSPSPDGHLRSPSKPSYKSAMVSETTKPAPRNILVRSKKPNVSYADGLIVHGDEKWVAVKVNVVQEK